MTGNAGPRLYKARMLFDMDSKMHVSFNEAMPDLDRPILVLFTRNDAVDPDYIITHGFAVVGRMHDEGFGPAFYIDHPSNDVHGKRLDNPSQKAMKESGYWTYVQVLFQNHPAFTDGDGDILPLIDGEQAGDNLPLEAKTVGNYTAKYFGTLDQVHSDLIASRIE